MNYAQHGLCGRISREHIASRCSSMDARYDAVGIMQNRKAILFAAACGAYELALTKLPHFDLGSERSVVSRPAGFPPAPPCVDRHPQGGYVKPTTTL